MSKRGAELEPESPAEYDENGPCARVVRLHFPVAAVAGYFPKLARIPRSRGKAQDVPDRRIRREPSRDFLCLDLPDESEEDEGA